MNRGFLSWRRSSQPVVWSLWPHPAFSRHFADACLVTSIPATPDTATSRVTALMDLDLQVRGPRLAFILLEPRSSSQSITAQSARPSPRILLVPVRVSTSTTAVRIVAGCLVRRCHRH
ncbi:hypothetical protein BKA80DRAFT_279850 [Phyllosticta citrichinensis]